jgi:hypothetical protein
MSLMKLLELARVAPRRLQRGLGRDVERGDRDGRRVDEVAHDADGEFGSTAALDPQGLVDGLGACRPDVGVLGDGPEDEARTPCPSSSFLSAEAMSPGVAEGVLWARWLRRIDASRVLLGK